MDSFSFVKESALFFSPHNQSRNSSNLLVVVKFLSYCDKLFDLGIRHDDTISREDAIKPRNIFSPTKERVDIHRAFIVHNGI